ncbi:hypothetical protein Vafri_15142, partial [Volvox africanus]
MSPQEAGAKAQRAQGDAGQGTTTTQILNSQLLLDLQAALSAALEASGQSQASQSDLLVAKLRSGVSVLLNAFADASRNGAGLMKDIITVLSVAEFVAERLPVVFCGPEGLHLGSVCGLLGLLLAAAGRYRSLLDRMAGLLIRMVDLVSEPDCRGLMRDLAAGAMELILDAEQQLFLLSLPPDADFGDCGGSGGAATTTMTTASATAVAALEVNVAAFECFYAHGLQQWRRHQQLQPTTAAAANMGEAAAAAAVGNLQLQGDGDAAAPP